MGKGRKPIPAAIKLHEGNPGKRKIPREPQPTKGLPQPPDYLDEVGIAAWHQVLDTMGHSGVITMAEAALLELYADTFSKYQTARRMVDRLGIAIVKKDKDGKPEARPNPFANQLHKYRDAAAKLLVEMGMTPVARARIGLSEQEINDVTSKYMA